MLDRRRFLLGAGALALPGLNPPGAHAAPAFSALGSPVPLGGDGFQVIRPVVSARDQGGYFAAWAGSETIDSVPRYAWFARRYAADGTPATVLHEIDSPWTGQGIAVVALADGNALAIGIGDGGMIGRTLTAAGFGARRVIIGSVGTGGISLPMATRLANGTILVVWSQGKVYGRILTSTMNPVTKAFLISTGAGIQSAWATALAPLASGGAVVAMELVRDDGTHHIVQRLRPGGGTDGPALRPQPIATPTASFRRLGVVGLPQGRFALLWHGPDEFGGHIYTDDGATVAPIAPIRTVDRSGAYSVAAVACGGQIIVAPATGGVALTAFDGATGQRTLPFTTVRTGFGDCIALARLSNNRVVASTFDGTRSGWLQHVRIG